MSSHHELIPAADPSSRDLLVVLHGLGDSLEGYRWLPQALGLPWLGYLLVNAPDDYYGGFSWYAYPGDAAPGILRSRRLLGQLLETLPAKGFLTGRTALFGFSQGCLMALETGLRHPERLAAIIGVSGYVSDLDALVADLPPTATRPPVLVSHGTHDPLIPCVPVRAQMDRLRAAGVEVTWKEWPKDHTILPQEIVLFREFLTKAFGR